MDPITSRAHELPDDADMHCLALSPADVVELQDQLFEAATDLDRLAGLLEDAAGQLTHRFSAVDARLGAPGADVEAAGLARRELAEAVTALQFQDMAAQVITHTVRRIRGVADFLGSRLPDEEGESASVQLVRRHCPVAQRQIDAGSVELF